MGGAEIGGGFFTGWKGITVGIASIVGIAGLAATGYVGSDNNTVILGIASSDFTALENDFGEILYSRCRVNGTYDDGNWQEVFPNAPDGDGGTADLDSIELRNLEALVELGEVFEGNDSSPASYRNRPESACFSVCRVQFAEDCTFFTYDGITADSCRFVSPGQTPPEQREVDPATEGDHFYIFNGTCMQEVRENFLAVINQPKPDLDRPNNTNTQGGTAGSDAWDIQYLDAMAISLQFLRAQWAGDLGADYNTSGPGNEWRRPGFVEKDAGCPEDLGGSFATGDHIQSTMATAEQTGVMSLARLWWRDIFIADTATLSNLEIARQAVYLSKTWDADAEEVMVGVGDQRNGSSGPLLMYTDFGRADFALQVGENPDNEFGQPIPVAPECTYTTADVPAADVAAHAAAGLALASMVVTNFTVPGDGAPTAAEMLESAAGLFSYSKSKAPLDELVLSTNATDAAQVLGASEIYPTSEDSYVRSHQLWAACTLFQATQDEEYWTDAETIYTTFIRPELDANDNPPTELEPYQLFDPVANYYNPVWWGMLCMAQSAPEYTGLEDEANLLVPRTVGQGDTDTDTQFEEFLLDQEFQRGSRAEATQQIWQQFVLPWITYDASLDAENQRVTESPGDSFRYFDINGPANDSLIVEGGAPGVQGVFRDSASAAVVALMYADLPGVETDNSFWARCMAMQTVHFMLGDNADSFSYVVGFGSDSPVNPYHKDAACPGETVRAEQFEFVFNNQSRTVDNPNNTQSDELSTRLCDFLTFQGDPALSDITRPDDEDGNSFYSIGDSINPVLDNTFNLTGALVSSFLPAATNKYTDERMICPDGSSFRNEERSVPGNSEDAVANERCSGEDPVANPLSQVSVDANGALTAALAGLANLPQSFFDRQCPEPAELAAVALEAFTTARNAPSVVIEDINPNVATDDDSR